MPPPRVLVVTVVHDPEDARIRHRELVCLVEAGAQVSYAAPFTAYGRMPPPGVRGIDLPRAQGRHRLAAVRAARRLVRAEASRQDAVLVHDPELLLALAGLRGPARVWDVHEDTAVALGMRGWLPAPLRPVAGAGVRALERWADRRLHLLLAEDAYQQRFRHPHPVVPNTVFVPRDEPPPPGDRRARPSPTWRAPWPPSRRASSSRRAGTTAVAASGPCRMWSRSTPLKHWKIQRKVGRSVGL